MDASTEIYRVAEEVAARLKDEAQSDNVKEKLGHMSDVCRQLVSTVGRLTVPSVVSAYAARELRGSHLTLAEQSIRNRRGGNNPYFHLYQAWSAAAQALSKTRRPRRSRQPPSDQILGQDDLDAIQDLTLRHLVTLVIAENRNLRNERNILKQLRGAPVIGMSPTPSAGPAETSEKTSRKMLNEAEVEALRDFVDPRALKRRGLRRAADGAVETIDARALSDPGFIDALEKIIGGHLG